MKKESPPYFIMEKTIENKKKKKKGSLRKRDGFGSRLRVEKLLALHNVCPKTVPLTKWIKQMWLNRMLIFLK